MFRLFGFADVQFVFRQQFEQTRARHTIIESVGQAQCSLQQLLGLGRTHRVEIHEGLPTQRARSSANIVVRAPRAFGFGVPRQRIVKATAQTRHVAEEEHQERMRRNEIGRQSVQPNRQGIQSAGAQNFFADLFD